MTGVGGRPEVVLEGAAGPAGPWTEYQFRYKPGNTSEAPAFVLPHQPRLDWQMWFAALGSYEANPWLVSLAYRLLEGRPAVLALLSPASPWRDRPPALIRSVAAHCLDCLDHPTPSPGPTGPGGTPSPSPRTCRARTGGTGERRGSTCLHSPGGHRAIGQYGNIPRDHQPLKDYLTRQGILGAEEEPAAPWPLGPALHWLRQLSDAAPPHLQIWTYAWLALPLFKPFLLA
jgi:hypothetical protein